MNFAKTIADELNLSERQIDSSIKLFEEDNSIPFIARYRKEVTGGLTDEQLRKISERPGNKQELFRFPADRTKRCERIESKRPCDKQAELRDNRDIQEL